MFNGLKRLFSRGRREGALQAELERLRRRTPVPLFWLFGKTQSGKTSVVKFLTGADSAEIGRGFKPCTRFSRQYEFPTSEAPLLSFLDTRGLDEPGYASGEDLARFNTLAHVVIVTIKARDHAQENVLEHLRTIRAAQPSRPVLLALTCLHEGYPQQQHPTPYPFQPLSGNSSHPAGPASQDPSAAGQLDIGKWTVAALAVPEELRRNLSEQCRRFEGLFDVAVPIDLTKPEEGFNEPDYGGDRLKKTLLDLLPAAYRQTLVTLDEAQKSLQDLYSRHALPYIVGYSSLAATAGAFPIPWLDLLVLPGIQTRMIYTLASLYGQPLTGKRFLELAGTLGMGMMMRQAARELVKFIPFLGSVASGALAG